MLQGIRLAIPTKRGGGLEDAIADVFGRAKTFTIIDIEQEEAKRVEVLQNPAASYKHGAGPIVVKMLVDAGVNVVLVGKLGLGSSALLEQHNIIMLTVNPGLQVSEAIKKVSWSTINIRI